jgi:hypothetical protein
MGRITEERIIDGETYTFTMLRPRISLRLLTKIFKLIGPPIGKAFPKEIKMKDIFDAGIDIGGSINDLAERLSDDELQSLIDILFAPILHKGKGTLTNAAAYDELFAGRMKHLFKVIGVALEVQYADFLEGDDALAAIIRKSKMMSLQDEPESKSKIGPNSIQEK